MKIQDHSEQRKAMSTDSNLSDRRHSGPEFDLVLLSLLYWLTSILADPYASKAAEFIPHSSQIFSHPHPHRSHLLVCAYALHRNLLQLHKKKNQSLKKQSYSTEISKRRTKIHRLRNLLETTFSIYSSNDFFPCGFHNWQWAAPLGEVSFRKTWKCRILISKWFVAK